MDSYKKLTIYDGITVTKGYVSGEMSFEETVDYLSRLGISGLYENVITKAVVVPSGFRATNLVSNKVYESGNFIPVPENTWDEFVSAAQSERNDNWNIEETGASQEQEKTVNHADYQSAVDRLSGSYDEQDLGVVYKYLMNRVNEIQDEELRASETVKVNEFILDVHAQVDAQDDISLDDRMRIKSIIDEFRADVEVAYQSTRGVISITLGKGDIHFGAFVAAMDISGNQNVLQKLQKLMSNVKAGKITGQVDLNVSDIFPNGLRSPEEKEAYRSMLLTLKDGSDEERLIMGVSNVGATLKSLQNATVATPKNILLNAHRLLEEATQAKEYLESLDAKDATQTGLLQALTNLEFAKNVRDFQHSLVSGNLLVQTVIDYSEGILGKVDFNLVSALDEHFDFSKSIGTTLADALSSSITQGEKVGDDVKSQLKEMLYDKVLAARDYQDIKQGRKKPDVLEQFSRKIRSAFASTTKGGTTAAVSGKIELSNEQIDELFEGGTLNEFISNWSIKNPDTFRRIAAEEVIAAGKTLNALKPRFADAGSDYPNLLKAIIGKYNLASEGELERSASNLSTDLKKAIKKPMATLFGRRQKGMISFIDKGGNIIGSVATTETGDAVGVREDSVEGLVSLASFAVHTSWRDSTGIDSDAVQRAATAAVFFSGGSDIEINPDTGGLVNVSPDGTTYMHMRMLSLARFLPPLGKDGYQWANDVKTQMDRAISLDKKKAVEDITDFDRLEYFSSDEDLIRPIHATGENIRAGLKNVRVGETNNPGDPRKRADKILTPKESEKLASIIDYNTDVGSNQKRVVAVNTKVRNFLGNRKATPEFVDNNLARRQISDGETFEGHSLVSIAARIRDYDEEPTIREQLISNLAQVAYNRTKLNVTNVPEHLREEVAEYIKGKVHYGASSLGKGKANFGYHLEDLAYMPILAANLEDAVFFEAVEPTVYEDGSVAQHTMNAFDGVRWKDKQGNTHMLGKLNGTQNGAIDNTHLVHNVDGTVTISGYEVKMEENEPAVMHHGSADHATRFLANYYAENKDRISNITYNDTTMLSASWGDGAEKNTYAAGVQWKRTGDKFVQSGSCLDRGVIHAGDYR